MLNYSNNDTNTTSNSKEAEVLSKAICSIKDKWDLTNSDLASIIGVDKSTITRICRQESFVDPNKKNGELSLMLVRVFRGLGVFLGDRMSLQIEWLNSYNKSFNSTPIEAIKTVSGLAMVLQYLDALRGQGG